MKKMIGLSAALVGAAMLIPAAVSAQQQSTRTGVIYHDLYIKLKDASPANIQKQLELGKRYLPAILVRSRSRRPSSPIIWSATSRSPTSSTRPTSTFPFT